MRYDDEMDTYNSDSSHIKKFHRKVRYKIVRQRTTVTKFGYSGSLTNNPRTITKLKWKCIDCICRRANSRWSRRVLE